MLRSREEFNFLNGENVHKIFSFPTKLKALKACSHVQMFAPASEISAS